MFQRRICPKCIFQRAIFPKGYFSKVYFSKVYFSNVYFSKVYFSKLYFSKAYFSEGYFSNVYFWKTYFSNVFFWQAYFSKVYFSKAYFSKVYFWKRIFPKFILLGFGECVIERHVSTAHWAVRDWLVDSLVAHLLRLSQDGDGDDDDDNDNHAHWVVLGFWVLGWVGWARRERTGSGTTSPWEAGFFQTIPRRLIASVDLYFHFFGLCLVLGQNSLSLHVMWMWILSSKTQHVIRAGWSKHVVQE